MINSARRMLAVVAVLAAGAVPAFAESRSEESVTPLGLLRRAELVAVVTAVEPTAGEVAPLGVLRIDEVLRGTAKAGDRIPLAGTPEKEDLRAPAGLRAVAFLGKAGDKWEVLDGALGLVATEEVPVGDAPVVAFFRGLLGAMDGRKGIADPARVRALLVGATAGVSVRLRHGAALDLVRDPVLLGAATGEERAALVGAFDALPNKDRARFHLARVLGLLKAEGTAPRLVAALLAENGETMADAIGPALADLGDPKAVEALAAKAADPSTRVRLVVARALGASESPAARAGLESLLGSSEPAVRIEAALGVGRLRAPASGVALLRRFLGGAGGEGREEDARARKALAWALARCDDAAATAAVTEASRSDPDPAFRRFAEGVLRNPGREFVP